MRTVVVFEDCFESRVYMAVLYLSQASLSVCLVLSARTDAICGCDPSQERCLSKLGTR